MSCFRRGLCSLGIGCSIYVAGVCEGAGREGGTSCQCSLAGVVGDAPQGEAGRGRSGWGVVGAFTYVVAPFPVPAP